MKKKPPANGILAFAGGIFCVLCGIARAREKNLKKAKTFSRVLRYKG